MTGLWKYNKIILNLLKEKVYLSNTTNIINKDTIIITIPITIKYFLLYLTLKGSNLFTKFFICSAKILINNPTNATIPKGIANNKLDMLKSTP